jgi:cytochrome d ubiquinol oxidase subunit I
VAAAEALYNTKSGASFSPLTIGNLAGKPIFQIRLPHILSLITDLSWNGTVQGVNQIQAAEAAKYGHGSYVPVMWITYWSFRTMVDIGILLMVLAAWRTFLAYRKRMADSPWFLGIAIVGIAMQLRV